MKAIAAAAAIVLVLLGIVACGYAEWTSLRCLRCGTWGLARQLRLGTDLLYPTESEASHSISLGQWRLETEAGREPPPFPSLACGARGHLWYAEQAFKRGLVVERPGRSGMNRQATEALTRGIDRWSMDGGFRAFCRASVPKERLGEVLLPGDAVHSDAALRAWDRRLGELWRAYDGARPREATVWRWEPDPRSGLAVLR